MFDAKRYRQQFPIFKQKMRGGVSLSYLDNAATTQVSQSVLDSFIEYETTSRANVHRGSYYLAELATLAYMNARKTVARYLNAYTADEIVFTAGTTASINLLAFALSELLNPGDEILVSEAEHHSNYLPWQQICSRTGAKLRVLPVSSTGRVDTSLLSDYVSRRCRLIAMTHCSNVTGLITDVSAVVDAAAVVGAKVLLDGAQMVPHGPVDMQSLGIDFYVFSGHKCFGPTGVGVLWGKKRLLDRLPPFQTGGGMVNYVDDDSVRFAPTPRRFEAGTPPVAQAVALAAALEQLMQLDWPMVVQHEQALFAMAVKRLQAIPRLHLLGYDNEADRQPVLSFTIDKIHPHDICHIADQHGVAIRGGHHCAQPLLRKLGVGASTRFSFAAYNTEADVYSLAESLEHAVEVLT